MKCYAEQLASPLRKEFDGFIASLSSEYAPKTLAAYKERVGRFLLYCQAKGADHIGNIDYSLIIDYHENKFDKKSSQMGANAAISAFMGYQYNNGHKGYGYSIINHYLGLNRGSFWNNVKPHDLEKIVAQQNNSDITLSLGELLATQNTVLKIYKEQKYSYVIQKSFKQITDLLYLFLDSRDLLYSPESSWIWYDSMMRSWKSGRYLGLRRPLFILERYVTKGSIEFTSAYRRKASNYDLIPDWCKPAVKAYLLLKKAEGHKTNSIVNYRVQISKFCLFLKTAGINSFSQINATILKAFNKNDQHSTSKGKNAYNSTIRKFIVFLDDEEWIDNPYLFLALPCVCAPEEKIVSVLSKEEIQSLNSLLDPECEQLSLRDKAVLKLGIKMGIRPVDIVNLKIEDINWDNSTVKFIQEKTLVEVCFKMPQDVINAIYRYLMQERPDSKSSYIFIASRAPYENLKNSVCLRTMKKAISYRDFVITRRTFATELLRKNVKVDYVIESLGQRGRDSVHHYLLIDEERMCTCPIRLNDYGIPMKGGFCYA